MGSISPSEQTPKPIRLTIFECDTPLPQARAQYETYGGMFEALILQDSKNEPRDLVTVTRYQVDRDGAEYPDLGDVDVIFITGSSE